ncbi:MAG: hypothetical protein QF879_21800, partial [Candidatus Latescibacteria bacterium]|nr:hypothetical protein [Candidatus Latescibacterota bacterium]
MSIGDQVAVFEFDENTLTNKAVGSVVYTGQGGGSNITTALNFDGSSNNYVTLPNDLLDGMVDMTIEFWIRSAGIYKSMNTVFSATQSGGNDFWINFKHDKIDIHTQHGNLYGYVSHQNDQWYHVAMVREGSTLRVFEDGIFLGETSMSSSPFNITGAVVLGQEQDGVVGGFDPNQAFEGQIDELRVWDIAHTAVEIQTNMYSELSGNETGLVGYWNCNTGENNTLIDQTLNENDGVIFNATWSEGAPNVEPLITVVPSGINGIAWEADPDKGLDGFSSGDPMTFRYFSRRDGEAAVYTASHIPLAGTGNFGALPFTVVQVTAESDTLAPARIGEIPDVTILEDSGPNTFSVNFNDYFIHALDPLSFVALSSDTSAVTVQIDGSTAWAVTPAENWYGTTEVYIAGYDGYFYTYDTLQVTVAPVNDAPVVAAIPDVAFNEDSSYVLSLDSYTDDVDNDSTEHDFTATVLDDTTGNLILSIDDSTHYLTFSSPTDSTGSFTVMVGVLDDS